MTPARLLEHFLERADWVDREKTVDRILVGDPEAEVDRCLVTWMPGMAALRHAVEHGFRLVVCHEPLFWEHRQNRPNDNPLAHEKLRFAQGHGLIVLRNHDCWDRWPDVGIPWAWARFLGFAGPPAAVGAQGYQHRYDVDPVPLDVLAAEVARRCASLGEPAVQAVGEGSLIVSRVGIGTGCGCDLRVFMEIGCDCSVVCDDGSCYWAGIQRARDVGHPVIRANHGTSQEPGMVTLTEYLNTHVPGLQATHLPHGCAFRLSCPGAAPG